MAKYSTEEEERREAIHLYHLRVARGKSFQTDEWWYHLSKEEFWERNRIKQPKVDLIQKERADLIKKYSEINKPIQYQQPQQREEPQWREPPRNRVVENELLVKEQNRSRQLESELSAKQTELIQEQNKVKQLEIEKNNRPDITLKEYNELLADKGLSIDWKSEQSHLLDLEKKDAELTNFLTSQGVSSLTQLITNIQNTINKCSQLEKEKNNVQKEVGNKQTQINTLTNENKELNKRIKTLEKQEKNDISLENEKLKKLQEKITELEKQKTKDKEIIEKLENKIISWENKARQFEQERNNRPNITLEQWDNHKNRPTESKVNLLEEQLKKAKEELDKKTKEYYEKIDFFKKEIDRMRAGIDNIPTSTTDKDNPYEILGIDKSSTWEEIKKVYRGLSLLYHPDKIGNAKWAEERFKKISSAYSYFEKNEQAGKLHSGHSKPSEKHDEHVPTEEEKREHQERKRKEAEAYYNQWREIGSDFNLDPFAMKTLTDNWRRAGFVADTCKKWIKVGLKASDYEYAGWLADVKKISPEKYRTEKSEDLRKEFAEWKSKK